MALTVPTFRHAPPRSLLWPACVAAAGLACAPDDSQPAASFAEGCVLNTADACDDCLEFEQVFRIGSLDGSGFISGRGGEDQIVRDGTGNFWLGQGDYMNLYGPDGAFIRTVGSRGEGPMEFERAYPFHADAAGNVHVWDPRNLRVSIISPAFELVDERPIAGQQINDMMALDDGDLYGPGGVTPDNPLPNHLTDLHVDASGRVWVSRLEDGLVADVESTPEGAPLINLKRIGLRGGVDR